MQFSIVYSAEYRYEGPVHDQHNAARVRPAQTAHQRVEGFELETEPGARLYRHTDHFGTEVIQFAIAARHERFAVRAEARVATDEPQAPSEAGWEGITTPAYREAGAEFLGPLTPPPDREAIAALAAETGAASPLASVHAVCEMIPDRFTYRPGVTYVGSTVNDLLAGGAGVCQDFVHLALSILRTQRIATRYVSGYLFAPNGDSESSAEVNTHAWIEALLPDGEGGASWAAFDPTNRGAASSNHVKIGHGRAYSDVPPIRGVYRGSAQSSMEARVTMTRLPESRRHG